MIFVRKYSFCFATVVRGDFVCFVVFGGGSLLCLEWLLVVCWSGT